MKKKLLGDISWILIFTIFLICFPSKMNNAKAASGNVSNTVGEVKEFVSGDTVTFEGEQYGWLAYYFLYDEEQEGRKENFDGSCDLTLPTVEELKKSYENVYNLLNEKNYKFPKSGIIKWKIEALGEVWYQPTSTSIDNNTELPGAKYITYSITPVECDCSLSLDDTDCTWTNENQNQIYGYAGEEITLPNQDDISKSDNYLLGWKEGEAEDSTATYSYTFSGQEKTLYPVWTSVGVKVNNGSGTGGYKKGDTVTITANKIEGNDFVEWTVDSGNVALNDASSETTTFTMGDESAEITARYKHYSVKFLNEDGSQIEEQTVEYGKDATAPEAPIKEGYTFKGWDKDFTKVNTNLEVKPIFEINKYSVKFLNEDGSQIGEEQIVEYGKDATAPETPTKENYTFKGWDKDFTKVSTNLEVKPIFEINKYSVKFLNEDGSQIGEEQTVEYGKDATAPKAPTKEGYTFKGWDKDFTKVSTNLEVKPIFEINKYTVKFLNEDGSQIGEEQTVEYGKDATAPEAPTKENYTFKGWDKDFTKVSTNLEVKPIFEINKYTVKFLNEDGSQIGETQTVEYGKGATAPKAPTKEGYTFKGWDKQFNVITSNMEIKAVFTKNEQPNTGDVSNNTALLLVLFASMGIGLTLKKVKEYN